MCAVYVERRTQRGPRSDILVSATAINRV